MLGRKLITIATTIIAADSSSRYSIAPWALFEIMYFTIKPTLFGYLKVIVLFGTLFA
jgi:hypothetical protein